jgi:hypothetical protein
MAKKRSGKRDNKRQDKRNVVVVYALLLAVALSFRVGVARFYANDSPDDGRVYAQIARNVLEQHVYSHESQPPYVPSLIRLPGYPLFLAGIYSVFGHGDNTAVRIVQALLDTASCALISLVAYFWEPDEKRKRRTSIAAFSLAAVCPFTTIYVATILTETLTIFFAVAMCLTATLALKANRSGKAFWLWVATGLISGVAVLFRPESGLFALAIGITLVVSLLGRAGDVELDTKREELLYRSARAAYLGAVFSLAFCVVLVPWTVRNYRVFHLFQPLAPAHAEMPGEFVPRGYLAWLRTWIDDSRYVGPVLWALETSPIKLTDIPNNAFDSAEEKQRVAVLLEKYNHPSEESELFTTEPDSQAAETPAIDQPGEKSSEVGEPNNAASSGEEPDESDKTDEGDESDENNTGDEADEKSPSDQAVEMTPEIDAGFARIAQERIARNRLRYYLWLPLKRAHSLWFDTHSQYYPFEGDLLPLDDLDYDIQQQYWLPLFAGLTLIYTVLGFAGGWFLWLRRDFISQQWALLATLMVFLRLVFFATLENPEPRYAVEVFPFLSILGAIAVVRIPELVKIKRTSTLRQR